MCILYGYTILKMKRFYIASRRKVFPSYGKKKERLTGLDTSYVGIEAGY